MLYKCSLLCKQSFFLIFLIVFSTILFTSCSDSTVSSDLTPTSADNSTQNNNQNTDNLTNSFDDQAKESNVDINFNTNPLSYIGRYRITSIKVISADSSEMINESYSETVFKGNFGVGLLGVAQTVDIGMALKYQFYPTVAKAKNIDEGLAFLSKQFSTKRIDMETYGESCGENNLTCIIKSVFEEMGATIIRNGVIEFSLNSSDIEALNSDESLIIMLEKVGNEPKLNIISNGVRYWEDDGSIIPGDDGTVIPGDDGTVEPGDDGTVDPGDDGTVDPGDDGTIPGGEVLTPIDINDLNSFAGSYETVSFSSVASVLEIKETVASDNFARVQKMKGEITIDYPVSDRLKVTSKMQMNSTYLLAMRQDNDTYTYMNYPEFSVASATTLTNTSKDKIEVYTTNPTTYIKITQTLKKIVTYPSNATADVTVTVIAKKVSNIPKTLSATPKYWDNVAPEILKGYYKPTSVCYEFTPLITPASKCWDTALKKEGEMQFNTDDVNNVKATTKIQMAYSLSDNNTFTDTRWSFLYFPDNLTSCKPADKLPCYRVYDTSNPDQIILSITNMSLDYSTKILGKINVSQKSTVINIIATKISEDYHVIDGTKFF